MNKFILSAVIAPLSVAILSGCNATPYAEKPIAETHQQVIQKTTAHDHGMAAVTDDEHPNMQHHATWGYNGPTGPKFWGDVAGNEACKIGAEQSPINIRKVLATNGKAPQSEFIRSDLIIENNGHTVVYTPTTANNKTVIDGDIYTLKQFHYHAPSEHQISGVNYPAEIHYVHANAAGNLAVVGVMLNPTATVPTLGRLADITALTSATAKKTTLNGVDLSKLLPVNADFYAYEGSLTTPPCSEHVKWFVADRPLSVTNAELVILKDAYTGNNRPVQSQGERPVILLK